MQAVRNLVAAAGLMALAPVLAAAADSTAADILPKYRPTQPGVEYDNPTDKAAVDACKVETVRSAQGKAIGTAIRDGQGKLLRKFIDSNGLKDADGRTHIDQWSYYQNGFEVYREVDANDDTHIDEIRWMNSGGTRTALVRSGRIVGWKRISAEESSRILVQALTSGDVELLETVIASPNELQSLGAPKALIEKATLDAAGRAGDVKRLQKELIGWKKETVWQRFDGTMPHVIPADAGLKADLLLYENAYIFAGSANGAGNPMNLAYLQVPELIKLGETWKFVELPRAIDPKAAAVPVADSGFRAALFVEGPKDVESEEVRKAVEQLTQYDQKNAPGLSATKEDLAKFHRARIDRLHAILKVAKAEESLLNYTKQVVDSLAAAFQSGLFAEGANRLDQYAANAGKIGSYAAYRKIGAQYALDADQPGNELPAQKAFLGALEKFLDKYPGAEEEPDVLLSLGIGREFNAEEQEARKFYARLAKDHPDTQAGKKAAGAVKRLDLVGKPLELAGMGLNGKPIRCDAFRGKTLLITFWTSGPDPVRRDLPELKKVYEKYAPKGLAIIGVNLDESRETLDEFLKENPLPWPQIHEPGGMDSRLADEFGIISQPTMFLVDADGNVVNRSIHSSAELDRFLAKLLAGPVRQAQAR